MDNDQFIQIVEFDEQRVLESVKAHLARKGLMLANGFEFKYDWAGNVLHVNTRAVLIDDPKHPLIV